MKLKRRPKENLFRYRNSKNTIFLSLGANGTTAHTNKKNPGRLLTSTNAVP